MLRGFPKSKNHQQSLSAEKVNHGSQAFVAFGS